MENAIKTAICKETLDIQAACDFVSDPANGGIDIFAGAVRNNHLGHNVTGITYDAHESLAQASLEEICKEAQGIWPQARYYVAHYRGYLPVGGLSVLIAVSAPHREEAFDACRYVIEEIKRRLPVWKKEHYEDGDSAWLPGHSLTADDPDVCCGKCGTHG